MSEGAPSTPISVRRILLALVPVAALSGGIGLGMQLSPEPMEEYTLHPDEVLSDAAFSTYFENKRIVQEAFFAKLAQRTLKRPGTGLYNLYVVNRFRAPLEKYLGPIVGKKIVELGPGDNLGTGVAFALAGADRYYGLDIYQPPDFDDPWSYARA
jgi:hypothetical protein